MVTCVGWSVPQSEFDRQSTTFRSWFSLLHLSWDLNSGHQAQKQVLYIPNHLAVANMCIFLSINICVCI